MFDVKAALCVGRGDVTAPCSTRADIHLTVCVSPFCLICNLTRGYSSISPRMALTDSTVVPIKVTVLMDHRSHVCLSPSSRQFGEPKSLSWIMWYYFAGVNMLPVIWGDWQVMDCPLRKTGPMRSRNTGCYIKAWWSNLHSPICLVHQLVRLMLGYSESSLSSFRPLIKHMPAK